MIFKKCLNTLFVWCRNISFEVAFCNMRRVFVVTNNANNSVLRFPISFFSFCLCRMQMFSCFCVFNVYTFNYLFNSISQFNCLVLDLISSKWFCCIELVSLFFMRSVISSLKFNIVFVSLSLICIQFQGILLNRYNVYIVDDWYC